MSEIANGTNRTERKSRVPADFAGEHLVFGELKKRGFDAQVGPREHEMLVRAGDSPPTPIQVKTVHVTPWYVRHASFVGSLADKVTVLVLLGIGRNTKSARFFIAKNEDLIVKIRLTTNCKGVSEPSKRLAYGYIDCKSVEQYEDNWDILR